MGVYIKGMDMPENCAECFVVADVCRLWEDFDNRTEERHSNCQLVEVKAPHGRLIDENAVMREFAQRDNFSEKTLMDFLMEAPTVLKAEEKDDG